MEKLKAEITELKAHLAEARETLNAIRMGELDALVASGPGGDQIFTLQGAETPYRILVEEMNQGALMLLPDGTILYANTRFAELSKTPLEQVIGSSWQQFFPRDKHPQLETCLKTTEPVSPPGGVESPGCGWLLLSGSPFVALHEYQWRGRVLGHRHRPHRTKAERECAAENLRRIIGEKRTPRASPSDGRRSGSPP